MQNLEFDTGLGARAFAQAKLAQFITEPGLIVRPGEELSRRVELWKASGVREVSGADGNPTMVVWGPPVEGERLAAFFDQAQDDALAAVSLWIQAILALGEDTPPLWPSAAMIRKGNEGSLPSVFFAPPALINRSVTAEDALYVNPALNGKEAAAFTAAAMLYRVFVGTPPFTAADTSVLHEDMRECNFLPIRFAVPGLDSRLASLIQAALDCTDQERPTVERRILDYISHDQPAPERPSGTEFLIAFLEVIQSGGQTVSAASLIQPLAEPDRLLLEKEKTKFLRIKTVSIKTRRFIARNTAVLLGALIGLVAAVIIIFSIISSRVSLPTTAGMEPIQVIGSFYNSFGELDHQMMEACVTRDAGKNDIKTVINFYVLNKTRQAYKFDSPPLIYPAHQWQGGDFPAAPLFGATDLRIEQLEGDERGGKFFYRVDYTFWIPEEALDEDMANPDNLSGSRPFHRRDFLTLVRKKGNWRIAEIVRE